MYKVMYSRHLYCEKYIELMYDFCVVYIGIYVYSDNYVLVKNDI